MLERKGLGIRLGAAIIDSVIGMAIATVVVSVAGGVVGGLIAVFVLLAYPLIEIAKAQSPGKMILKLKIHSDDGSPVTRDQLIQRSLIRWSPSILGALVAVVAVFAPALAMLGNLGQLALGIVLLVLSWQTINTTKQAFWDVRAKTAVMGPATSSVPIGFQPVMSGDAIPPTGSPVTTPPATTMPPQP
jgi:uncharacterized RDD family membrane protein YckC